MIDNRLRGPWEKTPSVPSQLRQGKYRRPVYGNPPDDHHIISEYEYSDNMDPCGGGK